MIVVSNELVSNIVVSNERSLKSTGLNGMVSNELVSTVMESLWLEWNWTAFSSSWLHVAKPGDVNLDQSKKNITPYFGTVLRTVKAQARSRYSCPQHTSVLYGTAIIYLLPSYVDQNAH